jgi:hypothetical protein
LGAVHCIRQPALSIVHEAGLKLTRAYVSRFVKAAAMLHFLLHHPSLRGDLVSRRPDPPRRLVETGTKVLVISQDTSAASISPPARQWNSPTGRYAGPYGR